MQVPDLIGLFIGPLEEIGLAYMVTGGVAAVVYGDPRFTRDIDLVLELHESQISSLARAFGGGAFYVPPPEALKREASRRQGGHFNIIHRDTALRADVYLLGDGALHQWGFERRKPIPVGAGTMCIAPIEYVILRKLEYFRDSASDRHLRDVAHMCRISSDEVSDGELLAWVDRLGLSVEWAAVQQFRE
ncbi:MAG: hypothetical protein HKN72_16675 [Gemmatimonadetes bacterium]|nr:hypothetical protein [Gemmatimonadota bacterium]